MPTRPVVAIFQHHPHQGPGFLLHVLQGAGLRPELFDPDERSDRPADLRGFAGLVVLGSDHSVNEDRPWIHHERALVRQAVRDGIPVMGHCFGSQLLAQALGARVGRSCRPQIGWKRLRATPEGRELLGQAEVWSFNWHYEAFGIPRGATRVLAGAQGLNKGFVLGPHMGFQCHFEVTQETIEDWCAEGAKEVAGRDEPTVQSIEQMLSQAPQVLPDMHATARRVYARWIEGVRRRHSRGAGGTVAGRG
ncbi:MAG: type 1 glutamine amidotransferase [Burkholderiales bacterium]|nr:type 1 glutamine amidotransferase [Burkholderiales bacterium]